MSVSNSYNICPTCGGGQLPDHPAGVLAWQHRFGCPIRNAEATRLAADRATAKTYRRAFRRPATNTERQLLGILVNSSLPTDLTTTVVPLSDNVIRRRWPQLERPPLPDDEDELADEVAQPTEAW